MRRQIIDVKADLELLAVVIDFDFLFGLFLLRIVSLDGQCTWLQRKRIAVFLVGKDGARCSTCRDHPEPP